uniref:NB-ARC domain-containing protein n=1 Tax=Ananas comosus var. bracteatus TaxID=296719 RepID=A0A6V7QDX1_ANACO|nr:unnamed protein product [Ananas comosus var. bracteatus]
MPAHLSNKLSKVETTLQDILPAGIEQQVIGSPGPSSQEEDDVGDDYEWTCSYVDESMLYGDKDEAEKIIKALVKDEDFNAVGIVGSYGSGKTNLARKVFIDEKVKDEFPLRLWERKRREDNGRYWFSIYTKRLEVDEGFRLFKRAFDEAKKNSNLPVEEGLEKKLEEMKKQIVDKCLGFPAALMAAGRGLATQQNPCVD